MNKRAGIVVGICFLLGLSGVVQAQDEDNNRRCLPMSQIDRLEVVDDQSIIFHMRGGEKYINRLPYRCSGLKNNTILHETSLNSYCDLDTISVVDTSIGMRIATCPLGEFETYTPPESNGED